MTVNTPVWQSYLAVIKDIITAIAALTGIIIAILGLWTWKRQLRIKTEYELARRLLRAVYMVRESIRSVRSPGMGSGEIERSIREASITAEPSDSDYGIKTEEAVYRSRWKSLQGALTDMDVELLEAEVTWGSRMQEVVKPLRDCVATLYINIQQHLNRLSPRLGNDERSKAEKMENRRVIYILSNDPKEDSFTAEVYSAVERVENFVKPHLKL